MDKNVRLQRKKNIITADMRGSAVTMDTASGKYYNLGETGGTIWKYLKDEISFGEIVDKVAAEYEIKAEDCESDIGQFIETLISDGLVSCI